MVRNKTITINKIIAKKLADFDIFDQKKIDEALIRLDGTENKSKLGANAILPVSMAVCRAGAGAKKVTLYQHLAELSGNNNKFFIPLPMFNILNGGRHVHIPEHLDIQEFMIVPHKKTIAENLVVCSRIFNSGLFHVKEHSGFR